jgi:hypothetical protein
MSDRTDSNAAPPCFWRWFWHEQAQRPTGRQLAFVFLFTTGVTILMIPGWYWVLPLNFPLMDVESGAALLAAVLVALVGTPFSGATAYTCRPSGWRVYLWTSVSAAAAALVAQTGIVAAVELSLGWSINRIADFVLSGLLGCAAMLPALGVVLTASYFLFWPRVLAQKAESQPPTIPPRP